ncbi:hypothetical protein KK062_11085 [Fulvivirgaceae bacterium PWU5]|uniref:Uncharacterized protein n=1 Tax=Dawidia cretensis TaxID=2782350 RepID=A0AAP2DWL5_9BACT|nr:hypothetical protein [Dawidia cretensis]MBT1708773.1 hypothetical protein [Dawidia cretensis]
MLFFLVVSPSSAQQKEEVTRFYFNVNAALPTVVHEIQDQQVHLQYHDRYGQQAEIVLNVYDWKHEAVGTYHLSKMYGLNYYSVGLSSFYGAWKEDEIYTFELQDEAQHRYTLYIRKVGPPKKEKPTVNIFVNPLHLECSALTGNVVEFYGAISGGKPPYKVNWYIMNKHRTGFLYQPREEMIERAGNTMVVRVDKNPDYYVMVQVRDACGNEERQMVNLMCEDGKKQIHTLFVEPLKQTPELPGIGN